MSSLDIYKKNKSQCNITGIKTLSNTVAWLIKRRHFFDNNGKIID